MRIGRHRLWLTGLILLSACLVTCKKYPKNILVLNNPLKVVARGENKPWHLELYSVNNIDSTSAEFLKIYREKGLTLTSEQGHEKYNCSDVLSGFWEFFQKKKIISFKYADFNFFGMSASEPQYVNQRNIFPESGLRWKIEKLTKDAFWIIAEYNDNKYELHFK